MHVQVFAIRDSAVESFAPPFYARSKGEALRSFEVLVQSRESNVAQFPQHFCLWHLGSFDDQTGVFIAPDSGPVPVVTAEDLVKFPDRTVG